MDRQQIMIVMPAGAMSRGEERMMIGRSRGVLLWVARKNYCKREEEANVSRML